MRGCPLRVARGIAVLVVLLGLTAVADAASVTAAAGPAASRVDVVASGTCGDAAKNRCGLRWDQGDDPHPGDDRLLVQQNVHHVEVAASPSPDDQRRLEVDLLETSVRHPAFEALNASWTELNASRPATARPWLTFESRAMRHPGLEEGDERRWGLFLVLHPPRGGGITAVAICWDVCALDWGQQRSYLHSNETHLRLVDDGLRLTLADSDATIGRNVRAWGPCAHLEVHKVACPLPDLRPFLLAASGLALAWTPAVSLGVVVARAVLHVGPAPDEAAAGVPSRNAAVVTHEEVGEAATPPAAPMASPEAATWPLASRSAPSPPTAPSGGKELSARVLTPVASTSTHSWAILPALALALAWWSLYHRIQRQMALVCPTRRRVYREVAATPGLRRSELARRAGVAYSTTRHHLDILAQLGLVCVLAGPHPRYVLPDHPWASRPGRGAALAAPPARRIHQHLLDHGPARQASLPRALTLAPSTVSKHLGRLEAERLVQRVTTASGTVAAAVPFRDRS